MRGRFGYFSESELKLNGHGAILMLQKLSLLDAPEKQEFVFNVYHDESGNYIPRGNTRGNNRWLLHGVLFVPEEKQDEVVRALQQIRQDVGYYGEVHYTKIRGNPTGLKARCAKGWLNLYARQFADFCFYHCLAVDTHSPGFEHDRFGEPHHAYNRFARMAIEDAIAWSLKGYQRVALKFYSDAKFRREGDNFADYIPRETCKSITKKRQKRRNVYPEILLLHPEVIAVDSDPQKVDPSLKAECELVQLVDLMTSSIGQALTSRSGQEAKIALSEMVARWIQDTCKPPWLQTEELYRRFSVSCFPNSKGQFYNPTLAVMNRNQPLLLDFEFE
ncbi:MAG: hypothetical protein KatS3mg046_738 [Bellilinea sp.]|nr:MAG: hypothetical protein KatS3mg046_738 [Bellilinea sp.]